MENYEIVIVGAGITGLCAAHTFLSIDPTLSLLVIDCKASIGGVWAAEQLYPGLRTNHSQGYYEYADLPLLDLGLGVKPRGIVPGEVQHAYLEEYVRRFDLERRIRLNTRVVRAVEQEGLDGNGWVLHLSDIGSESVADVTEIVCGKLILATGQCSTPNQPKFKGSDVFAKPIVHSVDLGKTVASQLHNADIRKVTVVGGSRSALDAVSIYASAGKSVTWLMRSKGKGRGAMPTVPPYSSIGPFKVWSEGLLMSRPVSWFSAAPWSDGDGFGWIRSFLHSTTLGNKLVGIFYAKLNSDSAHDLGLHDHENTKVLIPDGSLLWYGTQISSVNYDQNFYDLIRNGTVRVIRGDIDHLDATSICLEDGRQIESDAIICGTGWDYSATVPLEPASMQAAWGCPVEPSQDSIHHPLDDRADRELLSRYPLLKRSPPRPEREPRGRTPWRLWRFIAPPSQVPPGSNRNLAFLNACGSYQNTTKAEISSLWAYAYLYDKLAVPSPAEDDARYEACLWSRFGKWQVPYGMQGKVADFLFNALPYYDLLLRDLGLSSWRKGRGWFGEVFGSWYNIEDHKGIVDEWLSRQKATKENGIKI